MDSEQEMVKAYERECRQMAKEGTLTPQRQIVAMMMYLPQSYIQKQVKDKFNSMKK